VGGSSVPLRANDWIRTDRTSRAKLILSDGTECDVKPGTQLTVSAKPDRTITLTKGSVTARVAPQPAGHPLTFVTPRAEIRVLGTVLEVLALDRQTEVAVSEGKVRVTRTSDRASAEVSAGQFTSVAESSRLAESSTLAGPSA